MISNLVLAQNDLTTLQVLGIAAILLGLFFLFIFAIFFLSYFRWWIQSFFTGARVSFVDLVGMSFRKVKASIIVPSKIMAVQARLNEPEMTTKALERSIMDQGVCFPGGSGKYYIACCPSNPMCIE